MRLILLMIVFVLSGCSSSPIVIEDSGVPQSRLVYHPAYSYQGAKIASSQNWLLGSGKGLYGRSEYKLDFNMGEMGRFFNSAIESENDDHPNGMPMVTEGAVNEVSEEESIIDTGDSSLDICKSENINDQYKIGEWTLYYDTNKTSPNNEEVIGKPLVELSPTVVIVSGHTDDIGNDTYNFELSKQRALNAKDMLVGSWKSANFDIRWGGECPRAVLNVDAESRALNRRVVITAYNTPVKNTAYKGGVL